MYMSVSCPLPVGSSVRDYGILEQRHLPHFTEEKLRPQGSDGMVRTLPRVTPAQTNESLVEPTARVSALNPTDCPSPGALVEAPQRWPCP